MDDLPATDLVRELLAEGQLMIADQTMRHWPTELHLPEAVIDRDNRDRWTAAGALDTQDRATAEVERRLAGHEPVPPDPTVSAELRRIVRADLPADVVLPGDAVSGSASRRRR